MKYKGYNQPQLLAYLRSIASTWIVILSDLIPLWRLSLLSFLPIWSPNFINWKKLIDKNKGIMSVHFGSNLFTSD